MTAVGEGQRRAAPAAGADGLVAWAEKSGHHRPGGLEQGGLRFVFYGRVSTEDWQDPVTTRARQREQAEALVRGRGVIVAEFFDAGQSRTVAWGRRPEAALIALLADPGRGWDAIVIGEYENKTTSCGPQVRIAESLLKLRSCTRAAGGPDLESAGHSRVRRQHYSQLQPVCHRHLAREAARNHHLRRHLRSLDAAV